MRTELVSRLVEPARPAAVNAYRKNAGPPVVEKREDTVELSAEAKRLHAKTVENDLERAFMERVQTLRHQFSSGQLHVDASTIDKVADRIMALL